MGKQRKSLLGLATEKNDMAIHIIPHANIVTTYRVATDSREYEPLKKIKHTFGQYSFVFLRNGWQQHVCPSFFLMLTLAYFCDDVTCVE